MELEIIDLGQVSKVTRGYIFGCWIEPTGFPFSYFCG